MTQAQTSIGTGAAAPWLNRQVLFISLSACFADLGYQAVAGGLPLLLVIALKQPAWVLGLTLAVAYGPGAVMALLGGRLGDRFGHKKMAITGNLAIPLLSLSALSPVAWGVSALFVGGWWGKNFRSPCRRVMLVRVSSAANRAKAFGFLHALDIGGGFLSALGLFALLAAGAPLKYIFLITVVPLLISTLFLVATRHTDGPQPAPAAKASNAPAGTRGLSRAILAATALYGFSSFSFAFPILTVTQATNNAGLGVLAYVLFFGASAITGLIAGRQKQRLHVSTLAVGGYLLGGLAAGLMAAAWAMRGPLWWYYVSAVGSGIALGVIETLEPTLVSRLADPAKQGGGMGMLTAMRGVGLFAANLTIGVLYIYGPQYSYAYAATLAVLAATILLIAGGTKAAREAAMA